MPDWEGSESFKIGSNSLYARKNAKRDQQYKLVRLPSQFRGKK
jgi:hypothetical protein